MTTKSTPKLMFFTIGGFLGTAYQVIWKDDRLRYSARRLRGQLIQVSVQPKPAEWQAFWRELDRIGVWDWDGDYTDMSVRDGTSWALEIEAGGHKVEASGMNAYPPKGRGPSMPPTFRRFLTAFAELLGGQDLY